ncbi:FtsK/SpoIIIE domain-containing protein [Nocardia brasiliensis]|uniref:FtsK/SpoIIIE domain-containing protein n=1 Tax=Nocardia brasiliensis TaxID=37326 RepID=UPI0024541F38|nr:FtsK/SpoIIIE domain-containing protein [Nocardia brasiliensis]
MSVLTAGLITGVSLAVPAGLFWIGSRGATRKPKAQTVAEIVDDARPELRTAVSILADPLQTNLMLAALGLGSAEGGFPHVERYDYTRYGIAVDVVMLGGQSLKNWSGDEVCNQFATYLAVPKVTVVSPAPSWVRLQVRVFDTLVTPATPPEVVPNGVDLEAVPVGVTEDGDTWRLRVLYAHILIAGAMGSGKGSVLWSLLAGVGPAIKAGLVDVRLGDPKGGAEFGRGEDRLFTRFCVEAASILAMLAEAVKEMDERAVRMRRAGLRKLIPTVDEPLILIIIDEAAALSSYATRDEQEEFRRLTGLLLSKGRAVAVSVVAALQDPSKETMPNRQLFPVRIGLRLDEPTQNAMVHGQGARDRGARCDEISEHTPGVGYVGQDGTRGFVRVRAFWVDDDAADAIVDAFSPAPEITGPTEDYSDFDPDDLGDEDDGEDGDAAGVAA